MTHIGKSIKTNIHIAKNNEGGKQFALRNGGDQTCAVSVQHEFTMIGGFGDTGVHGKVDRCSNHWDNYYHSLYDPGTALKANTWVPFPTWPHLEITTAAQALSANKASRWKLSFFCISKTGLACCGGCKQHPAASVQRWVVLPVKQKMDNRKKPSKVKIIFKSVLFVFFSAE